MMLSALGGLVAMTLAAPADAAYVKEIESWRAARVERLKGPEGWLATVGLFWLEPGDNLFGSDAHNPVVLPRGPKQAGVLHLENGTVKLKVAPGVTITEGDRAVTAAELKSDASGAPTKLKLGAMTFFVIDRGGRLGLRLRDAESEARKTFSGIPSYAVDPAWRFEARFERYQPAKVVEVPNILGMTESMQCPGAIVFSHQGKTYKLDAVLEAPDDTELFVIFGDLTNRKDTYPAGRFLYTPLPDAEGRVVLDFNKAYNPPCAFTAYATCPLPPPQNKLDFRVEAGERRYGHH